MRRPRLNALRTFEAAGRKLSFSLAAVELNITQAAVSQQIRQLEAYLGQPLFHRTHRRISLTTTGQTYLDAVGHALGQLDTVTDQLFGTRPDHIVTIRCTSSVATLWLGPNIQDFRAKHPDINLHIKTLEQEGAASPSTSADLEIFVSGKADHSTGVTPLLTSVIMPVAAPQYLKENPCVHARDILDFSLIHILGYDDDWRYWFQTYDLDPHQVPRGLSADSSLFAIDAALRGDGIFLGRRPFIDTYLKSGQLAAVFQNPHTLNATYYLRQNKTGNNNRNADRVAQWLQDLAGRNPQT